MWARCSKRTRVGSRRPSRGLPDIRPLDPRTRIGRGSAALADPPDLLGGPLAGPFERGEVVVAGRGVLGRTELDEVLDLEAVVPEEPDPVAVAEVEVDRGRLVPLGPVKPEVRAEQRLRRRQAVLLRDREDEDRA